MDEPFGIQLAKWEKVANQDLISRIELEGIYDPKVLLEETADYLVMRLEAFVLTAATGAPQTFSRAKSVSTEVPSTWWDHFKLQYSKKWWMPFKKVRYTLLVEKVVLNITVEPRVMFPHAQVKFPQSFNDPVIYYKYDVDWINRL